MPKKNKYLDFVSDEHFLECVKYVCDSYPQISTEVDMGELGELGLDVFKMIFDINTRKITVDDWINSEVIRQADKTVSNRVGEFHQKLLGGVKGWKDLGRGHSLGIDLKNDKNTIFIELKNKHNTVKGEDLKHVFDKLKRISDQYLKAFVYYAYIIPKRPGSGERVWRTSQREQCEQVMEAWGARVYEIVTRDKNALEKTWIALPKAVEEVLGQKSLIRKKDMKRLAEFFRQAFQ